MKQRYRSSIYPGWTILAGAFIVLFLVQGARSIIGVMFKPMLQELSWSRSALSLAAFINMAVFAISLTVIGKYYDRYGARRVGHSLLGTPEHRLHRHCTDPRTMGFSFPVRRSCRPGIRRHIHTPFRRPDQQMVPPASRPGDQPRTGRRMPWAIRYRAAGHRTCYTPGVAIFIRHHRCDYFMCQYFNRLFSDQRKTAGRGPAAIRPERPKGAPP